MRPKDPFVYFDLGKVMVEFEHAKAVEQLAALAPCSVEQVRDVAFTSGLQNEYETGLINSDAYCQRVNSLLNANLPREQILEAISDIFTVNQPILETLQWLRDRRIPMGILSNTCSAHWDWIVVQNWPIPGDWFELQVLSYEVRSMKPDARIYEVCEERARRGASDLFFTDDRIENIEAAQNRGWSTYHFGNAQDLIYKLQSWLEGSWKVE